MAFALGLIDILDSIVYTRAVPAAVLQVDQLPRDVVLQPPTSELAVRGATDYVYAVRQSLGTLERVVDMLNNLHATALNFDGFNAAAARADMKSATVPLKLWVNSVNQTVGESLQRVAAAERAVATTRVYVDRLNTNGTPNTATAAIALRKANDALRTLNVTYGNGIRGLHDIMDKLSTIMGDLQPKLDDVAVKLVLGEGPAVCLYAGFIGLFTSCKVNETVSLELKEPRGEVADVGSAAHSAPAFSPTDKDRCYSDVARKLVSAAQRMLRQPPRSAHHQAEDNVQFGQLCGSWLNDSREFSPASLSVMAAAVARSLSADTTNVSDAFMPAKNAGLCSAIVRADQTHAQQMWENMPDAMRGNLCISVCEQLRNTEGKGDLWDLCREYNELDAMRARLGSVWYSIMNDKPMHDSLSAVQLGQFSCATQELASCLCATEQKVVTFMEPLWGNLDKATFDTAVADVIDHDARADGVEDVNDEFADDDDEKDMVEHAGVAAASTRHKKHTADVLDNAKHGFFHRLLVYGCSVVQEARVGDFFSRLLENFLPQGLTGDDLLVYVDELCKRVAVTATVPVHQFLHGESTTTPAAATVILAVQAVIDALLLDPQTGTQFAGKAVFTRVHVDKGYYKLHCAEVAPVKRDQASVEHPTYGCIVFQFFQLQSGQLVCAALCPYQTRAVYLSGNGCHRLYPAPHEDETRSGAWAKIGDLFQERFVAPVAFGQGTVPPAHRADAPKPRRVESDVFRTNVERGVDLMLGSHASFDAPRAGEEADLGLKDGGSNKRQRRAGTVDHVAEVPTPAAVVPAAAADARAATGSGTPTTAASTSKQTVGSAPNSRKRKSACPTVPTVPAVPEAEACPSGARGFVWPRAMKWSAFFKARIIGFSKSADVSGGAPASDDVVGWLEDWLDSFADLVTVSKAATSGSGQAAPAKDVPTVTRKRKATIANPAAKATAKVKKKATMPRPAKKKTPTGQPLTDKPVVVAPPAPVRVVPHLWRPLNEAFFKLVVDQIREVPDVQPRNATTAQHVLRVTNNAPPAVDPVRAMTELVAEQQSDQPDLLTALRESSRLRPRGTHFNVEAVQRDMELPVTVDDALALDRFRTGAMPGASVPLSASLFSDDRLFMRSYSVPVGSDTWLRLRNSQAAVTVTTNFLLCVCATLQSAQHGYVLFKKHEDRRYEGNRLRMRLRAVVRLAEPMLLEVLHRGRLTRGQNGSASITSAELESAVDNVGESLASLQKLYEAKPESTIRFRVRQCVPIFVLASTFNRASGLGETMYTRRVLEAKLREGLLDSDTRVVIRLDFKQHRVLLTYKPSLVDACARNLSPGAARRHQVAVLPGGLKYVAAAEPGGRGHYVVHKRLINDTPHVTATDPGVRVFGTTVHLNRVEVVATNDVHVQQRMQRTLKLSDKLEAMGQLAASGPLRDVLRDRAQALRTKLRGWVSETHQQLAKYLVDEADIALFPRLPVAAMLRRLNVEEGKHRLIGATTSRQMSTWRHGDFWTKVLASKTRFWPGLTILDLSENYSSKGWFGVLLICVCVFGLFIVCLFVLTFIYILLCTGCNKCFVCNEKLGGKSTFHCRAVAAAAAAPGASDEEEDGHKECGFKIGRDVNGACGIAIRSLVVALFPDLVNAKAQAQAPTVVAGAQ